LDSALVVLAAKGTFEGEKMYIYPKIVSEKNKNV